jgi:RNA polymerase-associated protein LEO1
MSSLFQESSDDEDDNLDDDKSGGQPQTQETTVSTTVDKKSTAEATPVSKKKTPAIAEDDDDDDDSEDEKPDAPKASSASADKPSATAPEPPAPKASTSAPNNRLVIGDESDDDDEPEFDDGGAVVGSAAPERPAESTNGPSSSTDRGHVDRMDDSPAGGGPAAVRAPKAPQRAEILEADRPVEGVSLHMTKLPNVVGIQPEAFDPDTYVAAQEEDQYRGFVPNMVRWRYKRDGNTGERLRDSDGHLIRESNSRIVQWEDGSYTLHVGNQAFEVDAVNSAQKTAGGGFAGLNGYIYLSQNATFRTGKEEKSDDAETTPGGTVLECMGGVASRLTARPSSLQSDAHKSLTVAIRQRTIKTARIAEYVTEEDPEKAKLERIKYNEDADKIASKNKNSNYRSRSYSRKPGMNSKYLEEDDENYDGTSIRALKKRARDMDDDEMDDYGEDSEGEDDGYDNSFKTRASRKRQQRKEAEEDEEEDELVFAQESDEDDGVIVKAHTKKRTHQALLDDDDEDDDD